MRNIASRLHTLERRYMPIVGVFAVVMYDKTTGKFNVENVQIRGCKPPPGQAENITQMVHSLNAPPPQRHLVDLIAKAEV